MADHHISYCVTWSPACSHPMWRPVLSRLEAILGQGQLDFSQVANRIRLARIGKRRKNPAHFSAVSRALLERQQLQVRHYSREHDTHSDRTLSPQRLIFYRNNWYLEAWCHARKALRRFSVDALESVELLTAKAKEVPVKQLDVAFSSAYGIYGGTGDKRPCCGSRQLRPVGWPTRSGIRIRSAG
ncbi:helix-turn-helix transcriptional regulator [Candidatus Aalborgicola defluviihabitans]|uniref:helix-turn-helix transcriptional regulator n=1 Tax=Candidatus Aalborgicola defluviihabitans TaxID=3386187 RepID=UPI0039B96970